MTKKAALDCVTIARGHGCQAAIVQNQGDFGVRVVHKQGRRWKTVHIFDANDVGRLAKEVAA